jgi:hypothetical protein
LGDVVEITLRKMRRDGVPIPFMVEQLLHPKPAPQGVPSYDEHNPLGGFLAELEELKTVPPAKPAKKPALKTAPKSQKVKA